MYIYHHLKTKTPHRPVRETDNIGTEVVGWVYKGWGRAVQGYHGTQVMHCTTLGVATRIYGDAVSDS